MQASAAVIEVPQHEAEETQRLLVDELAAVLGTQARIRPVQPGGTDFLAPNQMYEAVGRAPSGPTVRVRAVLNDGHDLYDPQRDAEWPVLGVVSHDVGSTKSSNESCCGMSMSGSGGWSKTSR